MKGHMYMEKGMEVHAIIICKILWQENTMLIKFFVCSW